MAMPVNSPARETLILTQAEKDEMRTDLTDAQITHLIHIGLREISRSKSRRRHVLFLSIVYKLNSMLIKKDRSV
jgi:hypothetical protein